MAENKPGNGQDSPFGDGDGDATANGPTTGAHDFVTDPESHAPKTGGRDFTKESRPQTEGGALEINEDSIPDGGTLPFAGNDSLAREREIVGTIVGEERHKPFKI